MSENKRRRWWTPAETTEIVLAGLRGDRSVRDMCREYEITEASYSGWRDRLLGGGKDALRRPNEKGAQDTDLRDATEIADEAIACVEQAVIERRVRPSTRTGSARTRSSWPRRRTASHLTPAECADKGRHDHGEPKLA